ncbi:MAG: serine/threonine protein kinase [Planctomycetes bacterium]|nr:serine/threonine protein kinase [Planctomycetota bacterium]
MSKYNIGDSLQGGYHVFDIKAGGMGVVYLCFQPSTKRLYAIKTVRIGEDVDAEDFLERFRDEVNNWIHISAERRHPNIVDALLYNEDERWLFLEYVDGPHLFDLTRAGPAQLQHAIAWARDIAKGMLCLHEEFKLVHRDLKPRNVLVDQQGLTAKITDLGIGKVFEGEHQLHTLVGTPGYIAPETMRGETDFRADVYSFGAVFYRMLTGQEALGKGLPTEAPVIVPPSLRNPLVPESLDGIVLRCLEGDPGKRFPSFREVLAKLDGLPIAMADRDVKEMGTYRYCKTHRFHSPIASNQPDCIFCEHQRTRLAKIAAATEAVQARRGAGRDSATMVIGGTPPGAGRGGSTGAAGAAAATIAAAAPTLAGPRMQVTASEPIGRPQEFVTLTAPGTAPLDPTLALPATPAIAAKKAVTYVVAHRKAAIGVAAALVVLIVGGVYIKGLGKGAGARTNPRRDKEAIAERNAGGRDNLRATNGNERGVLDKEQPNAGDGKISEGGPRGNGGEPIDVNQCGECKKPLDPDDKYNLLSGGEIIRKDLPQEFCRHCAKVECQECGYLNTIPTFAETKCAKCGGPQLMAVTPPAATDADE